MLSLYVIIDITRISIVSEISCFFDLRTVHLARPNVVMKLEIAPYVAK